MTRPARPFGNRKVLFAGLLFSTEVLDAELRKAASDAYRLGFLETADVEGILEPRFAGPKAAMGGTR